VSSLFDDEASVPGEEGWGDEGDTAVVSRSWLESCLILPPDCSPAGGTSVLCELLSAKSSSRPLFAFPVVGTVVAVDAVTPAATSFSEGIVPRKTSTFGVGGIDND